MRKLYWGGRGMTITTTKPIRPTRIIASSRAEAQKIENYATQKAKSYDEGTVRMRDMMKEHRRSKVR